MAKESAAAFSITEQKFQEGIVALRNSVKSDALKCKWLHLVDWDRAESAWDLFEQLREASCCDKEGLRLWINDFVNNAIGFQLKTKDFVLHMLLISFTKVESKRGRRRRADKKGQQEEILKRSPEKFFFGAVEEDERVKRVLWNLRKYFHVEIADCEPEGLTTIHHNFFSNVNDWSDEDQVTKFLNSIRPTNKSGGESPKSKKSKVGRKPRNSTKQSKGKNTIKLEPSWSSDSELDVSHFSSEESYSQELAGGNHTYTMEPLEAMAVENYENQAGSNYTLQGSSFNSQIESSQFPQEFMVAPPRTFNYDEVVQYSVSRLNYVYVNWPERIQSYIDHLEAFFNATSASANIYVGNFDC